MGDGGVATKSYDSLNRYTNTVYDRENSINNAYNVVKRYSYKAGAAANQTTSLISRLNYKFDDSNNYILNYTYDNIGNITEVTDASGNTVGRYLYDKNGQLVLEEIGNKTKVYTYDTYGNILRETQYHSTGYASPSEASAAGMDEFAYIYGYTNSDWKDLLTSYRGQTITYDAAGNPLSYYNGQSYTFTWEDGNQLKSATVGGKTIDFYYNSDGIRTKKETPDATYYYRLSGSKVVEMAKESENGTVRYVFIYDADGNPHELHYYNGYDDTTPTKYFYVLNLQGDVIQLRDTSNAVVANYTYDAWGRLLSVKNASGSTISDAAHIANINPIRYRGYFYDTETKLYYCNSRYYDPQIKRFINADEFVSTGQDFSGYNMFAYCNNNPVMRSDPSGYISFWDALDIASAIDSWWEFASEPSWGGFGMALLDTAGVLPVLPSAGTVKHGIDAVDAGIDALRTTDNVVDAIRVTDNIVDTVRAADNCVDSIICVNRIDDLSRAHEYGIQAYDDLRKLTKGTGLQAHHIVEKRLADVLHIKNTGDMLSVAVTIGEHQTFTNKWRQLCPYGTNYSELGQDGIWNIAQQVYEGYPQLLIAAQITIFGGG